jgi:hypothetical protein
MNNIDSLAKSGKVDMKGKVTPGLKGGEKSLKKNVEFGDKSTKGMVKPEEVTKNFGDSAQFAAEINKMFPKEYGIVTKLRQDLKIHHFDLANSIKDVELLAQTTKDNLRRSIKKLNLRKKYLDGDKLKPSTDAKIWKYEVKYQNSDLQQSLDKCNAIVKVLEKLQKDCARTSDNLENVLKVIKEELKKKIAASKTKIADLEKQAAAAKCNFWQMIFTFGAACRKASELRNKLNSQIGSLRAEMSAAAKLDKRFHYFDSLKTLAKTLTQEASGLLDITKEFRSKLESTQKELTQDFTDEEIDDQLGDVDFLNDFAETLFDALDSLGKKCDEVIADCRNRKKRLTDALIWDKIGEEELVELAGSEAALMAHFYEMASGCTEWYSGASQKFSSDVDDMKSTITDLGAHKHIIMNYAREEFHTVKGAIFNIVDSLIDAQRAIESVDEYFVGRIKYMTKRIKEDAWKFQLKYSAGVTKRCESEQARVSSFAATVSKNAGSIAKKMDTVLDKFSSAAKADLKAWNCDVMYPEPKEIDLGVPKWLGAVTKFAQKGFGVYNMVKKFIPGGSKAGKGDVPGSRGGDSELLEFAGVDWGEAKEKAFGLGKKLLDDMEKDLGDAEENMRARRQIWRQAVAMCNEDRDSFVAELKATQKTIKSMAEPIEFSAKMKKFSIAKDLVKYSADIKLADMGSVSPSEMSQNQADLTQFTQDVKDGLSEAKTGFAKASALKATLIS